MAQCTCTANCNHHAGKSCQADAEMLSTEWLTEDSGYEPGEPISLRYCLLCILREEERRKAAAPPKAATSQKQ